MQRHGGRPPHAAGTSTCPRHHYRNNTAGTSTRRRDAGTPRDCLHALATTICVNSTANGGARDGTAARTDSSCGPPASTPRAWPRGAAGTRRARRRTAHCTVFRRPTCTQRPQTSSGGRAPQCATALTSCWEPAIGVAEVARATRPPAALAHAMGVPHEETASTTRWRTVCSRHARSASQLSRRQAPARGRTRVARAARRCPPTRTPMHS